MKTRFAAVALLAAFIQPVSATTFPTLTTIYVASGVYDDGANNDAGTATVASCSNVSGVATNIRVLILDEVGGVVESQTLTNVAHGASIRAATHGTFLGGESILGTGEIFNGVINVESLQSDVFCTFTVLPAVVPAAGFPLHAVRVNPHPGTVE